MKREGEPPRPSKRARDAAPQQVEMTNAATVTCPVCNKSFSDVAGTRTHMGAKQNAAHVAWRASNPGSYNPNRELEVVEGRGGTQTNVG
jgi:hypothetical protein